MHEQVFLNLIEKYKGEDKSLDRILKDPVFKDIPLPERIDLLKKYGHVIREGIRVDSQYWKDLAWGSAGAAAAALSVHSAIKPALGPMIAMGEAHGSGQEYTGPKPALAIGALTLSGTTMGGALGYKRYASIKDSLAARKLVKSYLKPEEGATTTHDAIHVITRS